MPPDNYSMDICAVCGQPEDHINHDVEEIFVHNDTYTRPYTIGHDFESTKSVT